MTQPADKAEVYIDLSMECNMCDKKRRLLSEKKLLRMRLPRGYWASNLNAIPDDFLHKKYIVNYLHKIDKAVGGGTGLLLWGDNDTGKTGIASVISKEVRRNEYSVLFLTSQQYLSACDSNCVYDDSFTLVQRAHKVDFLILDDLGKETAKYGNSQGDSSAVAVSVARKMEDLIRTRQSECRSTVVTTNLNPSAILKKYGKSFVNLFKERFCVIEVVSNYSWREKANIISNQYRR